MALTRPIRSQTLTKPFASFTLSLAATLAVVDPVSARTAPGRVPGVETAVQTTGRQAESGRVVVTLVLESVRIPAVSVVLRSVDRGVAAGETPSDAIGQVSFPDIPAGRYIVRPPRDGFAHGESAPFSVARGETEQVLVETRLTLVRESVDVIAPD